MNNTFLHLFAATAALIFGSTGGIASAMADSSADQTAGELAERFDIHVEDPEMWQPADLRSLLDGAEALPEQSWEVIGGPMTVEYVQRRCMFSMGRYSERCPTFDPGDETRFFVYDATPVAGEGPVEQLSILTEAEQRDLQLRRAVVHMAMVRLDEEFGWSESARWRDINGWRHGSSEPLNKDPWGYSRYLGKRSARLDLVTFAEEYFVRPEDLLLERADEDQEAQRRLEQLDADQTVVCQQFTKRRILGDKLIELAPEWSEPQRELPHIEAGEPTCPAFEQWARPQQLEGFELLLAAATADQPESLFGHLLLHVRYDDDETLPGEGFEPVYQFGAVTDTDIDPVEYISRGFLGGLSSVLELNTFRGIDRYFLQYQQRDLRRYRLQLTEEQSRQLLERVWEAERRIRYPYLFLSENCASFLLELIAPALDVDIPDWRRPIVMPTDVLDLLAQVDNGEKGALVDKQPETRRSNREIAEEAVVQRRALADELRSRLENDPELLQELEAVVDELDELDAGLRAEGWQRAHGFFDRLLDRQPELSEKVIDFVYHGVVIERYFVEMAYFARRGVDPGANRGDSPQTAQEILQRRREVYRHEDMEARREIFEEFSDNQPGGQQQTGRELSDTEQQIVEEEQRLRDLYMTVLNIQAGLVERHRPEWDGVEYLDERSESYRNQKQQLYDLSRGPSGRNRITVGGHYAPQRREGTIEFSYSLMEEHLGEIRRRGFQADLGVRILGVDAEVPIVPDALNNMHLELIALRYASLRRSYGPLREGLAGLLGWSIDGRVRHDGRRELWASGELTSSVLVPLWTGSRQVNHLVVEGGLAARYDVHHDQTPLIGATAGLFGQVHLYGDYTNVMRAGVQTGQFAGPGPQWRYDVTASAESRHALFHVKQRALVVGPYLQGLWTTRDYRLSQPDAGFESFHAGLRVQLPW